MSDGVQQEKSAACVRSSGGQTQRSRCQRASVRSSRHDYATALLASHGGAAFHGLSRIGRACEQALRAGAKKKSEAAAPTRARLCAALTSIKLLALRVDLDDIKDIVKQNSALCHRARCSCARAKSKRPVART